MTDRGRVRVEVGQKRVRAFLGGELVLDSAEPRLVWEKPYYPTYYVPLADVVAKLEATGETKNSPSRGLADVLTVATTSGAAERGGYRYPDSPLEELRGLVAVEWNAMDAWFEEDEQVYVHPRDPYKRIDILPSSKHVRVEIDGVTVADTTSPRLLFETGLPVRYYIPPLDVRQEYLHPSDTHTECPYKGIASYHSIEVNGVVHADAVWHYPFPVEESARITGMYSFYNEKVDIFVDGNRLERPNTVFS
ncbi:MAG: DUF427 domain-containing protein [Acidimicrobiia bacterium]|nr:DUF427 domain-containing protein [Acidimicrobiia bacterium]